MDHAFYAAVKTTGIYCRASCPARKPLAKNVEFYRSPEDAEAAGYRPCKRCRPLEGSTGTQQVPWGIAECHQVIELSIPPTQLFDWEWLLAFLSARCVPGIEKVQAGRYERSLRIGDSTGLLSIHHREDGSQATLVAEIAGDLSAAAVERTIVRMFDLEADLAEFHRLVKRDPLLGEVVSLRPGIRLSVYCDPFEGLIRAILGQQISVPAARTVTGRLVTMFGDPVSGLGESGFRSFPSAEKLAHVAPAQLHACGLTGAKVSAIRMAAQAVASGELDWERLRGMTGKEAAELLCSLPGIGPWTAAYVRMRTLGDRDAFPATDLGVLKAFAKLQPNSNLQEVRRLEQIAEAWSPFRAYATLHLWNFLGSH